MPGRLQQRAGAAPASPPRPAAGRTHARCGRPPFFGVAGRLRGWRAWQPLALGNA